MEIPPSSEWVQSWHTNEAGLDCTRPRIIDFDMILIGF
jgi:hypothetical protein